MQGRDRRELDAARTAPLVRVDHERPGLPIETIAELVGHASTAVTEEVYQHQLKPVITTGAQAVNTAFGQPPQGAAERKQAEATSEQASTVSVSKWLPVWLPGPPEDRSGGPDTVSETAAELEDLRVGVAGFEPVASSSRRQQCRLVRCAGH